jgi:hypothetical protein
MANSKNSVLGQPANKQAIGLSRGGNITPSMERSLRAPGIAEGGE